MFHKSQQSGRSMVEMLGVLAIMGVLSVAGIAGYAMAMKKKTVNDILSAATACSILTRTYEGGDVTSTAKDCVTIGVEEESIPSGITITGQYFPDEDKVDVVVTAKDE